MAVVGNEDGAHKGIAGMTQALNDTGFTVPARAGTYRVGEAVHAVDYQDLEQSRRWEGCGRAVSAGGANGIAPAVGRVRCHWGRCSETVCRCRRPVVLGLLLSRCAAR